MKGIDIFLLLKVLFIFSFYGIESANILGIFPYPEASQYFVAQRYLITLAERGHELTVISEFPLQKKMSNFRDILVKYDGYEDIIKTALGTDMTKAFRTFKVFFQDITKLVFDNPEVRDLLYSGKYHFDLVIVDVLYIESIYAISTHFNAHLIGISNYGTDVILDQYTGNTSPLSYVPLPQAVLTDRMTFWQRIQNLSQAAGSLYFFKSHINDQEEIYKTYLPHLPYTLDEVCKNFSLILLNSHFSINFPRPYIPNMIEVSGISINPKTSPLPKDIEEFLNGAVHGAIYFSLGLNFKSKYLRVEKREALLKVFGSLKQRILWKYEDPILPHKPSNVLIRKWFPQTDVLAHPNVKLFITHAGLLSFTEAIHFGKAIVAIPVMLIEFLNAERAKEMGFGLSVNYVVLNEGNLRRAILEVLQNETYTENAQALSQRYHDRPVEPLNQSIFWTEYMLRHNGAPFMRVAGKDLNFFQYHSLDTIGFILFDILILIVIAVKVLDLVFLLLSNLVFTKIKMKIH